MRCLLFSVAFNTCYTFMCIASAFCSYTIVLCNFLLLSPIFAFLKSSPFFLINSNKGNSTIVRGLVINCAVGYYYYSEYLKIFLFCRNNNSLYPSSYISLKFFTKLHPSTALSYAAKARFKQKFLLFYSSFKSH